MKLEKILGFLGILFIAYVIYRTFKRDGSSFDLSNKL